MAVKNLAIVTPSGILVYDDAIYNAATIIDRIPLGRAAVGFDAYTETLRLHGWTVDGRWGATTTQDHGTCPAVSVKKS